MRGLARPGTEPSRARRSLPTAPAAMGLRQSAAGLAAGLPGRRNSLLLRRHERAARRALGAGAAGGRPRHGTAEAGSVRCVAGGRGAGSAGAIAFIGRHRWICIRQRAHGGRWRSPGGVAGRRIAAAAGVYGSGLPADYVATRRRTGWSGAASGRRKHPVGQPTRSPRLTGAAWRPCTRCSVTEPGESPVYHQFEALRPDNVRPGKGAAAGTRGLRLAARLYAGPEWSLPSEVPGRRDLEGKRPPWTS